MKNGEGVDDELTTSVTPPAPLIPPTPPKAECLKQRGKSTNLLQLTSQQTWRDFSSLIHHEPEGLPE